MTKKIGVYICTGCEIGNALDIEALSSLAKDDYKIPVCRTHNALCSQEGFGLIKKDIAGEGVNAVVVAACSPRVKHEIFQFDREVLLNRVDLREQVIWSHPAKDDNTQMLAEDNLRMGIIRIQKMDYVTPFMGEDLVKKIMVVGGGLAGMTAALEAAKAKYEVVLVEKSDTLGGWVKKQHKLCPKNPPYTHLEDPDIESLQKEIENTPHIKMYTSSHIEKISGAPGMFDVTINQSGTSSSERIGSIVLATGSIPYNANNLEHLGYGKSNDVITREQMEELACGGKITRPSDGKIPETVTFLLCAGSRDENHLPYCSSICCMESLKQAKYIRTQNPEAKVFIIYRDIRTPGLYESFYKAIQEDEGIFFTKGEVAAVSENGNKKIAVDIKNTLLGEDIRIESDLVVLATGMTPTTGIGEEIKISAEEEAKKGQESAPPADTIIKSNILNLEYRQGPEIPPLKYGFPDSHFICFPYETRRTGIYAAGSVRSPIDQISTIEDAAGAALKAIQCVETTARGEAVHPRSGDMSYPELFMQRCTQCKRCTEECPFGTYNEDEKCNPLPNLTRCRRCGICMGSCPERIISFKDYSVDMIGSMVKAIKVPEEDEEKPRILVLACENDAYPALDMAGVKRLTYNPYVRIIPLRCVGSTNVVWIADALAKGIDGVLLLGCKHGDDYQCHFVKGSELANYRMSKIKETLDRLVLEAERVRFEEVAHSDYLKIPGILDSFLEKIKEIGPNPYKGW